MRSVLNIEAIADHGAQLLLSDAEVEAVLELAYLATAADDKLGDEEFDAFERAAMHLGGKKMTVPRLEKLLTRWVKNSERQDLLEMVAGAVAHLKSVPSREYAYQLAYVMSLSDLDTNDQEAAFEVDLRQALAISEQRAEALVSEALEIIEGPPDD